MLREDNQAEVNVLPDTGTRGPPVTPFPGTSSIGGRAGDGVFLVWLSGAWGELNRCSRAGLLSRMASIGQYGLVDPWRGFSPGNEGWSGSASRTSGNSGTTPAGGGGGGHMDPVGLQARKPCHHWGVIRRYFPQGNTKDACSNPAGRGTDGSGCSTLYD